MTALAIVFLCSLAILLGGMVQGRGYFGGAAGFVVAWIMVISGAILAIETVAR